MRARHKSAILNVVLARYLAFTLLPAGLAVLLVSLGAPEWAGVIAALGMLWLVFFVGLLRQR